MEWLVKQIQPRMIIFLLVSIILLSLAASWFFLFKSDVGMLKEMRNIRDRSHQAVSIQKMAVGDHDIDGLRHQVTELRSRLYGKRTGMEAAQMVSIIIGELDVVSDKNNIQLISVKPGMRTDILGFEELPFDVEIKGEYSMLYQWIQDALQELRPMVIKKFHLLPSPQGDDIRMELRIVSYRPPEEK